MSQIERVIEGLKIIKSIDGDAKLESEYQTLTCGNAKWFDRRVKDMLKALGWEQSEETDTFVFPL